MDLQKLLYVFHIITWVPINYKLVSQVSKRIPILKELRLEEEIKHTYLIIIPSKMIWTSWGRLVKAFGDLWGKSVTFSSLGKVLDWKFRWVEVGKSIRKKIKTEVNFEVGVWLVYVKNMGRKCIWNYTNNIDNWRCISFKV